MRTTGAKAAGFGLYSPHEPPSPPPLLQLPQHADDPQGKRELLARRNTLRRRNTTVADAENNAWAGALLPQGARRS
jgi:hypothetical protein